MSKLKINTEKNRIYLELGKIDTGGGKELFNQVNVILPIMKSDFTVVIDLTEFQTKDYNESVWLLRTFERAVESGIHKAAVLTGKSSEQSKMTGINENRFFAVRTLEEAETFLDSTDLRKRDHGRM